MKKYATLSYAMFPEQEEGKRVIQDFEKKTESDMDNFEHKEDKALLKHLLQLHFHERCSIACCLLSVIEVADRDISNELHWIR